MAEPNAPDAVVGGEIDRSRYQWDGAEPDFWGQRAWRKACGVCAFRADDPQELGAATQEALRADVLDGSIDFYCSHRRAKNGMHRICAGAAAIEAGREKQS